jgi:hypothetical protein
MDLLQKSLSAQRFATLAPRDTAKLERFQRKHVTRDATLVPAARLAASTFEMTDLAFSIATCRGSFWGVLAALEKNGMWCMGCNH